MAVDQSSRLRIRRVKRLIEDELLALPGVVAVDIARKTTDGVCTDVLALTISVRDKRPMCQLPAEHVIPREIFGVPTDVIAEEIVLHGGLINQASHPAADGIDGPIIQGGIGIAPLRALCRSGIVAELGSYGTLGVLGIDRLGTSRIMGITSFHVACTDDAWTVGEDIIQVFPGVDGMEPGEVIGTMCRAALFGPVGGAAILLRPGLRYQKYIMDIGFPSGVAKARRKTRVRLYGSVSGLAAARVTSTDATIAVDYQGGIGRRILRDQIRIDSASGRPIGARGDSGSALVDDCNRIIGLHEAGTTTGRTVFASPIAGVLNSLELDLVMG